MQNQISQQLVVAILFALASVSALSQVMLPDGLDNTNLVWATGGDADWSGQTNITHDGMDAAGSGAVRDGQTTWLQTTVTGPVTLSFWWRVSSEPGYDHLRFSINGLEQAKISGEANWQQTNYTLGTGTKTLRWTYTKDDSISSGLDAAWLDEVVVLPIPPIIASQPQSLSVPSGGIATFAVWASGSPPLHYQWRKDEATLAGATNSALTLYNVTANDAGAYSVVVSSPYGSATSSNAVLTVLPPPTLEQALDTTNLVWTTDLYYAPWFGQTNVTHDGTDAARSGSISDYQTTSLETTVTGPAAVSFWWKVSSEADWDFLAFSINSIEQIRISGEVDWQQINYTVGTGANVLRWTYLKDGSASDGQDAAWVDEVLVRPVAPTITQHPKSLTVASGAWATFAVTASGTLPLSFQWRKDGTNLPGATYETLALPNVTTNDAGLYSVVVSNVAGSVPSTGALLTVLPPPPTLEEALDTTNLIWSSSGSSYSGIWFGQTDTTHDGQDAAQCGVITNNQETWLDMTVTGPGAVSFWWRVSSEEDWDFLTFSINGVEQDEISGEVNWQKVTCGFGPGTNVLRWVYSKDGSLSSGQDTAWLDEVQIEPVVPPAIVQQPQGLMVPAGATATLTVKASGTPPLQYQWRKDGMDLTGATNATLVLGNVTPDDAGQYSVQVSNVAGSVTSSDAPVTVLTLEDALDTADLVWTTGGDAHWFGQTNTTHDGVDAARSGTINSGQTTWLETTVTVTKPSAVNFWWKVSVNSRYDGLRFSINGLEQTRVSGEVDWQQLNYGFAAGTNVLRWTYLETGYWPGPVYPWATWLEAAWLDEVAIVDPSPPTITRQPPNLTVASPGPATFSVTVSGSAPFSYQWLKDGTILTDGANVSGATSATLTVSDVTANDSALYVAVVTSLYGSATSSNACLTVLPALTQQGDWPGFARGDARCVFVTNGLAYLAQRGGGLAIVAVTDPANPLRLGQCDLGADGQSVSVVGDFAYVAAGYAGLVIVDVSNPASPRRVGGYDTSEYAFDLQVVGNFVYLADGSAGLQIVDVTDPTNAFLVGSYDTGGSSYGVQVVGSLAYLADGFAGLQIVDLTDPANAFPVGRCSTAGYAQNVQVVGSLAYVAVQGGLVPPGSSLVNNGLQIIDVTDSANPFPVNLSSTGGSAQDVQVVGSLAYLADGSAGLQIMDVSDPTNTVWLGGWDTSGYAYSVQVAGNLAYVADGPAGLAIIEVSNSASPVWAGGYETSASAEDVQVVEDVAFVADGYTGLEMIDVSNPTNPVKLGSYDTGGFAHRLEVVGNLVYLVDGTKDVQIVGVSDPANPVLVGSYDTRGSARAVQVVDNLAYVAADNVRPSGPFPIPRVSTSELQVVAIKNPATPALVGRCRCGTSWEVRLNDVQVVGSLAYLTGLESSIVLPGLGTAGWLQVIDVSNPANPVPVGRCNTPGWAGDFEVVGTLAYVADGSPGLTIIDISDPTNPVRVGGCVTSGYAYRVHLAGHLAYVANGYAGLQVIDVSDPANPCPVGGYDTRGDAFGVQVLGDLAYVADGYWGLAILETPFGRSRLVIADTAVQGGVGGPSLVFSVPTLSGYYYQVLRKTDLGQADWTRVGQAVLGTGCPLSFTNAIGTALRGFYRVEESGGGTGANGQRRVR